MNKLTRIAAAGVALAVGAGARADVIYSNLGPGDSFQDPYPVGGGLIVSGPSTAYLVATSFSTGASSWNFGSAELALGYCFVSGSDAFVVQIMTDSSGFPSTVLETISFSNVPLNSGPHSTALVTILPNAPLTLDANSRYWIALSTNSTSGGEWMTSYTSVGSTSTAQLNGAAWGNLAGGGGAMRINGTAVPEPRALWIGIAFVLLCRYPRQHVRR